MRMAETPYSRLTLCDDGILEAHPIQRETPRDSALLSQTMDVLASVGGGKPRPVLWDPAGTVPLRPNGWKAIIDRVGGVISALGIVLDEEETSLLGAYPEIINSLMIPVRIFDDAQTARRWLVQFVDPDASTAGLTG